MTINVTPVEKARGQALEQVSLEQRTRRDARLLVRAGAPRVRKFFPQLPITVTFCRDLTAVLALRLTFQVAMGKLLNMLRKIKKRKFDSQGQSTFVGLGRPEDCFGGSLLKNSNAKVKRPLDSKLPVHLVLRSNFSMMRGIKAFGLVNEAVREIARKHGVKVYEYANVGNHLHMVICVKKLRLWAAFIRELTGRVAQLAQGLKGPQKGRKFWTQRPFTRIVRGWKKAFQVAREYVRLNLLEAEGFISRKQTKTLKDLRMIWSDA